MINETIESTETLTREQLSRMPGPVLVEFGASWCGICRGFAPQLERALRDFPDVQLVWVEDGRGKQLGRSFGVTLWPTLVFQRDGQVVKQLARPTAEETRAGLETITRDEMADD